MFPPGVDILLFFAVLAILGNALISVGGEKYDSSRVGYLTLLFGNT